MQSNRSQFQKDNKIESVANSDTKQQTIMPIMRYDPFASFFDDAFERSFFHNNAVASVPTHHIAEKKQQQQLWQPRGFQVQEDEKTYTISVDVPGVKAEDMEMQLVENNQALHLRGGRRFQNGDAFDETKFERRFTIGADIDVENINAELSNGVLTIVAPKKEPEKESPRLIAIKEGAATE